MVRQHGVLPHLWRGRNSPVGASLQLNGYQVHNVMKLLSNETEELSKTYGNESLPGIFSAFDEVFEEWMAANFADF